MGPRDQIRGPIGPPSGEGRDHQRASCSPPVGDEGLFQLEAEEDDAEGVAFFAVDCADLAVSFAPDWAVFAVALAPD
jgi:hypothetical protein